MKPKKNENLNTRDLCIEITTKLMLSIIPRGQKIVQKTTTTTTRRYRVHRIIKKNPLVDSI